MGTECSDITDKMICKKTMGCEYDKKEKVCMDDKKPFECGKIQNKKKCNKTPGCTYDDATNVCTEDNTPMPLCEVFEKKNKCKKVSYCTWNENEDGESTCIGKACEEMASEKDCKWD